MIWMGAWRVNGNLSVSRAIGDAKQKHLVVGDADVEVFDLDGSEDYLVVACDGVWDVLNGEEIVKCVNTHLASPGGSKQTGQSHCGVFPCRRFRGQHDRDRGLL